MKKYIFLVILFLYAGCQPLFAQERKKVGVVLSGGGAKGAAHIGVLKALEEAGIPIDYIAGTSMGAVVGGLYAVGYTPDQLDSIIKGQDWSLLLSDKPARTKQTLRERDFAGKYLLSVPLIKTTKPEVSGFIRGENLNNLLSRLTISFHDSIDYNKLPIPFACVATNIVDGKEVVFHDGVLPVSIRASMAIPGVFTPVEMDSLVLVDGGLVNNYPVDVARDMGADIIIGSTVQADHLETKNITNVADILSQLINISTRAKFDDNIKDTDLHFQIDAGNFSTMDFKPDVLDSMIHRGYNTAHNQWDELMAIKEKLNLPEEYSPRTVHEQEILTSQSVIPVRKLTFQNANKHEVKTVIHKCQLKEDSDLKIAQIEDAVRILQDDFNYPATYYSLTEVGDGYDLTINVKKKNESILYLGLRFDSEEMISAIVGGELILNTALPSSVTFMGKLGKQYLVRLGYGFEPFLNRNLHVAYEYRHNDMDVYSGGKKQYNLGFRQHTGEIGFTNLAIRNVSFGMGLSVEHFKYNNILASEDIHVPEFHSDTYFNYVFNFRFNSQDEEYYPTRGVNANAGYILYTDDFAHYQDGSPISALNAYWEIAYSPTKHFTLTPSVYGRILWGHNIPFVYSNAIGGEYFGKYLAQQLPFAGLGHIQEVDKAIVIAGLKLTQRIKGHQYLSLLSNFALTNNRIEKLGNGSFIYGLGLKYGYVSKFGPIEASVGYSGDSKKLDLYVNLGCYF